MIMHHMQSAQENHPFDRRRKITRAHVLECSVLLLPRMSLRCENMYDDVMQSSAEKFWVRKQ
jgi:hypothetical protein